MSTSKKPNPRKPSNEPATEDATTAPHKLDRWEQEELEGLRTRTVDRTNPDITNASGDSQQRRGGRITFDKEFPERGFIRTKTASESLVEGIERRLSPSQFEPKDDADEEGKKIVGGRN